ncbi:hypothetical protein CONPUDRAFT_45945 [Coniophora puteana RWD-64-598 SS2]|uniref:Reverse transcriptase zinc-binding domain-containing protein n=1 Tax=Coniophora puteana (strain RWD-64-598) TaxID=741705 RepID=A0A5M3N538_CONPW|nr:uncharacterized protein CONPUDRAFT_45945 [Coniophora puteana RWD-64-598 SS2]EIW86416.1 hypothetical protein CONPUDRAFT_45945 [Coniophora puteana RWD-64-598 SS2]
MTEDIPLADEVNQVATLTGMALGAGTQRIFHKIIREMNKPPPRRRTTINVSRIRHAVAELNEQAPTTKAIWECTRDSDSPVAINGFNYKNFHDGYRLGDHWRYIPGFEERVRCNLCKEDESMEHILLECESPLAPTRTIWLLAEELCRMKNIKWPALSYGLVLGCGLLRFRNSKGKYRQGASRLFKIVVGESAHLIWKLRCERVNKMVQNPPSAHHLEEVRNRWIKQINHRLALDKILTNKHRFGPKALKRAIVLNTWSGTLLNEDRLPNDWVTETGVLVGITCLRPPGRNR